MSAYLMADVQPSDLEAYRASGYLEAAKWLAEDFGGRYLTRGGATQRLEGEWEPRRMVIIEFPTMELLLAWYHSDEYAPWKKIRQELTDSRLVAIEGIEH